MDKAVESVSRIIEATGPPGAIVAAAIVGLMLAVIIIAKTADLFDGARSDIQKTGFLDRVIAQYDKLAAAQEKLQRDVERVEAENDDLKDRQRELLTSFELARIQLRRAIDLLTAVHDGRRRPDDIGAELAELIK